MTDMSDAQNAHYDKPVFVLDRDSNPHPDLTKLAKSAAVRAHGGGLWAHGYWHGVADAMAAATGVSRDEIIEWLAEK
ncbi:MAG TPA: hypothetical protein VLL25_14850 [Acidimicrobiales bacterium]|nr:hypothetical protein [Acidimicrobiales bacterium]